MTVKDVRDLAFAQWDRYFKWRTFKERRHYAWVGFTLVVLAGLVAALAVVSDKVSNSTNLASTHEIVVPLAGDVLVNGYADGSIFAAQRVAENEMQALSYRNIPEATFGVNGVIVALLLAMVSLGLGTWFMSTWWTGYRDARLDYADSMAQAWHLNSTHLPTPESVKVFVAELEPDKTKAEVMV